MIFFLINKNFIEKEKIHTSTQVVNLIGKAKRQQKQTKTND